MFFLRFGLTPAQRDELPIGMGTWLWPYRTAMDRIDAEAVRGG